jgi:hypothetical protein
LKEKSMSGNGKFTKWDHTKHSPSERCEGTISTGQCINCKVPGADYCPNHGANKQLQARNREAVRNYRLQRWKQRVGEMAESDSIKSLREEVGILRVILEEMLNQCNDSTDLLLYSQRMSDLVMKIEKLVSSCDRLENRMGLLLSKDSVLQLAATYVQIINLHVEDPDVVESISVDMLRATEQFERPVNASIE